jgi:trehalose 2-sulfotransferase
MTRRNKVRLAVSWWKAIQSEEWHRKTGASPSSRDVRNAYHFEAIDHLLVESCMREAAIQGFFTEGGIVPLTIVYEDFIADYRGTVERVLAFLNLGLSDSMEIAPPFYARLADEHSEQWVQRFRRERQAGWDHRW